MPEVNCGDLPRILLNLVSSSVMQADRARRILARTKEIALVRFDVQKVLDRNEAVKMLRVLLHSPPASSLVKIIVCS